MSLPTKADRELAARCGIPADAIKTAREEVLVKGVHWNTKSGRNAIEFTQEGRDKIAELISVEVPKPAEKQIMGEAVNLSVIRPCRNPMFCTIKTPQGLAQDIRIRRGARVRGGMLLKCAHDGEKWTCVHLGFKPL